VKLRIDFEALAREMGLLNSVIVDMQDKARVFLSFVAENLDKACAVELDFLLSDESVRPTQVIGFVVSICGFGVHGECDLSIYGGRSDVIIFEFSDGHSAKVARQIYDTLPKA